MGSELPVTKRDQKRARVLLAGQIGGDDWQQEVRIRDISAGGALLSCEWPPPVDTDLSLFCDAIEIPARVAWVGNHFVGVQFLALGDGDMLAEQVGGALRVSAPRTYSGFDEDLAKASDDSHVREARSFPFRRGKKGKQVSPNGVSMTD